MSGDRLSRIFHLIFISIGALLLGFIFFKYLLPILLPFIIAWGIAFAVRPASRAISRWTHLSVRVISPVLAVLLITLAVGAVASLVVALGAQGWEFLSGLVKNGELEAIISRLLNPFEGRLDGAFSAELEGHLSEAVGELISSALSSLAQLLTEVVTGVPKFLFFLLITLIATVYFSVDLDSINAWVLGILPERVRGIILRFKENSLKIVLKYARSYAVIMLVTFAIMLIGFTALSVEYALLFAALVALLDALPVLGVGTVLVPYSVVSFIRGNASLGVGLLVLFAVNEIVRQLIEPKILGKHLGLHPLLTVVLLYAGYTLLGIAGLVLLPVLAVAVKALITKNEPTEVEESA